MLTLKKGSFNTINSSTKNKKMGKTTEKLRDLWTKVT